MKLSDGFSNLILTLLAFVFWAISFSIFIFVLKHFDLSYAFAIYAGAGVVFIAIIGFCYFDEPINAIKIISIILVVLGTVGLNLK